MDEYVNDILRSTSRDTEAVTVAPDGRWHIQKEESNTNRKGNPTPSDDEDDDDEDDDDIVEIRDDTYVRRNLETFTAHSVRTPPLSSREDSRAPSTSAQRSSKRPHDDVIDLTLSDDDDGFPPKKVQRNAPILDPVRSRPPENRYHFQLPPPHPSVFNFDRAHPSF